MQIALLTSHEQWPQALDLLRQLCTAPGTLDPAPAGLSVGLTGRPSAWQALALLEKLPESPATTELSLLHLTEWLLEVRFPCA
jgi:hypothetical protein